MKKLILPALLLFVLSISGLLANKNSLNAVVVDNVIMAGATNDINANVSSLEILFQPQFGTAAKNNSGQIIYTPFPEYQNSVIDKYTYQVCNTNDPGDCRQVESRVVIGDGNDFFACDDVYFVDNGTTNNRLTVLDNDRNADASSLNIILAPIHGSLGLDNGVVTYSAPSNYQGSDEFLYSVNSAINGESAQIKVTVIVGNTNELIGIRDCIYAVEGEDNTGGCNVGNICNDGDPCTVNDRYTSNCECQGNFLDSDNDGICDLEDNSNGNCDFTGSCNDGDPCTSNDQYDADCNCNGTYQDSDNDGICDVLDSTNGNCSLNGICNDGDPCTTNDRYDSNCNCNGTFQDSDNDGICDGQDNTNGNCVFNGVCNDGDPCTTNDRLDSNCNCVGELLDSDNDDICDLNDSTNGNCTLNGSCDDGNACTVNDSFDANCDCVGVFLDADNDGTCDNNDNTNGNCSLNGICNDGDPCTTNDRYDENCNCVGIFFDINNDGVCDINEPNCTVGANCNDGDECTINDTYNNNCDCEGVFADSDDDGVCDANDTTDDLSECDPGGFCDDGDPCTLIDRFDADCNCEGIFFDADGDGICNVLDQTNGDCILGAACDDGNANTENDVYDANCRCRGTVIPGNNSNPPTASGNCKLDFDTIAGNSCEGTGGTFVVVSPNNGQGHLYEIFDANGEINRKNFTGDNLVSFDNLEPGNYELVVSGPCDGKANFTIPDNGSFAATVNSDSYTLACGLFSLEMDVLANDSNFDINTFDIVTIIPASSGKLKIEEGKIIFNAENGFVGLVEFSYEVCDANACCKEVPVQIEVDFCTDLQGPCVGNILIDGDECGDEMGDIIVYNGAPGESFFHTIFDANGEEYAKNSTTDFPVVFKNLPTGTYTAQVERLGDPTCLETSEVTVVDCTETGDPVDAGDSPAITRCAPAPRFTVDNTSNACSQEDVILTLIDESYESITWLRDNEPIEGGTELSCKADITGYYSVMVTTLEGETLESYKQFIDVCPVLFGGTQDIAFCNGQPIAIAVIDNDQSNNQINFVKTPENGSVSISGNKVIYNPNPGFSGVDEMYYSQVQENPCNCELPLTKVMVNVEQADAPRAIPNGELAINALNFQESILDSEQASFDVRMESNGTLSCPLNLIVTNEPTIGTTTISNDRKINYVPQTGFEGTVLIEYMLCACSSCETGEIIIDVNNDELEFIIPGAISPNGDGVNDFFYIQNTEFAGRYDNLKVIIFNANGGMVYKQENWDNTTTWDGTAYSEPVPEGVYFYVLQFEGENTYLQRSGYFELRR